MVKTASRALRWLTGRVRPAFRIGLAVAIALAVAPILAHGAGKARTHLVNDEIREQEAASVATFHLDLRDVAKVSLSAPFTRFRSDAVGCPDLQLGDVRCWRYPGAPRAALPSLIRAVDAAGLQIDSARCQRVRLPNVFKPRPNVFCGVRATDRGHMIVLGAVSHLVFPKLTHRVRDGRDLPIGRVVGSEITLVIR